MIAAVVVAGLLAALFLAAAIVQTIRLRHARVLVPGLTAERDIAMGLLDVDTPNGIDAVLEAIAARYDARSVTVLVAEPPNDRGLRARRVDGVAEPLTTTEIDATAHAALEAVMTHGVVVVGDVSTDVRVARLATELGLASGVIAPINGDGARQGLLAVGNMRSADTRTQGVKTIAAHLSAALREGTPLSGTLETALAVRRAEAAQALHDPATGLPTRPIFLEALRSGLDNQREGHPLAVAVVRLGGLLSTAERLGALAGGEVLTAVAERLATLLRRGDTAARTGESEFALLLLDLRDSDEGDGIGQRIHTALSAPIVVGDVALDPDAAIGIRIADASEITTVTRVMRDAADTATAAAGNPAGFLVHQAEADAAGTTERLIADIRDAATNDEFSLVYQPIVSLDGGGVLGAEALLRWTHPSRGAVPPSEFLPLADESGLASLVGLWVLRHACVRLAGWQQRFPRTPPLAVSVNISAAHLAEPSFATDVLRVLHETGVEPDTVILEFAEDILLAQLTEAPTRLDPLQRAGVHLAIDDVGTGHTTLDYLKSMPVDILKIGRPFIAALVDGAQGSTTAHAIVTQGNGLRMSLVAEGVENALQIERLRELGCTMAQGYHLARPVDGSEMEHMLAVGVIQLDAEAAAASA